MSDDDFIDGTVSEMKPWTLIGAHFLSLPPPAAAHQEEARWKLLRHQQHCDPHVCGRHHPGGEAAVQRDPHTQVSAPGLSAWSPSVYILKVWCSLMFVFCVQVAISGHLLSAHHRGGGRAGGERGLFSFVRIHIDETFWCLSSTLSNTITLKRELAGLEWMGTSSGQSSNSLKVNSL